MNHNQSVHEEKREQSQQKKDDEKQEKSGEKSIILWIILGKMLVAQIKGPLAIKAVLWCFYFLFLLHNSISHIFIKNVSVIFDHIYF